MLVLLGAVAIFWKRRQRRHESSSVSTTDGFVVKFGEEPNYAAMPGESSQASNDTGLVTDYTSMPKEFEDKPSTQYEAMPAGAHETPAPYAAVPKT
jgi:hypothetical protein